MINCAFRLANCKCCFGHVQILITMDANNSSLRLPQIGFDMPITDLIMELEKLRYKVFQGTTHSLVFEQIKGIFHMLESIGSSRIEGNNTTIMDYVESTTIENDPIKAAEEQIQEIVNIEKATKYVEDTMDERPFSLQYVRELHAMVVEGLSSGKEGSDAPGEFRHGNVRISGSAHVPPDYTQVEPMMRELVEFINAPAAPKYDLLKICIAHHRFVWIHPFGNGNGRTVRLFTYGMLLRNVFTSKQRIINPTAIFCSDRNAYYHYLEQADKGDDNGLIAWSEYVLHGLKREIEKIDKLIDYTFLRTHILLPAIVDALENRYVTENEYEILKTTLLLESQELQAGELKVIFNDKSSPEISRLIKSLVGKKMLAPIHDKARKYVISFANNYLLRSILKQLDKNGFLPLRK